MKSVFQSACMLLTMTLCASQMNAQQISEFAPNPAGDDPSDTTFELAGIAGADFDLNIISIENDGFNGVIDRASNVTGTFDSNGLAVVDVPDFENPSFTVFLTDTFSASIGDDLDADNDGNLDVSAFGQIFDIVGVSDSTSDNGSLYSALLGGSSLLATTNDEPEGVFRDGVTGDFYQFFIVNGETEIYSADGTTQFLASEFENGDPTTLSFGAINPNLIAVPEPTAIAFLGLAGLGIGLRRRR